MEREREREREIRYNDNEYLSTGARPVIQRTTSRELKVEDALLYLDQVKIEFSDRPHIYNEFLEIMKNFKAQSITTPGVIEQVKQLFRGHNKLILGFNTFLPEGEGHKIELTPEEEAYPQYMQQQLAINYVTNIRNRFADEPEIYQSFLKILHTYQKEQNGIKVVLDQVSALFVDHPDLLMEFAYFLPDAVQEQAKERLKRAVDEAELRKLQRSRDFNQGRRDKENKTKGSLLSDVNQKKRKRGGATSNSSRKVQIQVTAERRFFDQVREILSSQSSEMWSEFVKCLDLYNRGAINRRGLFLLVSELFGPAYTDTLEELKALLSARSTFDVMQQMDLWQSIPLNEIDFSQCRRCTPSYRSLPSDYLRPIASARVDHAESSVLNDDWVSIPIGSEDSSSFKSKRKNQYEEALFRSEDERYDIDMIIDTNSSCIRILEPIADEIAALKTLEERDGSSPRFSIQLEKSNLGTIHLNAISRIYGEHGAEIIDLLRRNPIGSIPVILKRLKQKDLEWRKARQQLNNQWRDILVKNAARSLDHRSFYFRQQDKRSFTSRYLIADIKDIKLESGNLLNPGVSYSCPPSTSDQFPDKTPQLYMTYKIKDQIILRVVFKLLSHAIEVSNCQPSEVENIAIIWRNLFRVVFNMPVHFLYEARSTFPQDTTSKSIWSNGTRVLTLYGVGTVTNFDKEREIHEVQLAFGKSYLPYSAILGAESLADISLEGICVVSGANGGPETTQDISSSPEFLSATVNPPNFLFFGTQSCYLFLRLHHILTWRLAEAFELALLKDAESKVAEESRESDMEVAGDSSKPTVEDNVESCLETSESQSSNRSSTFSRYITKLYELIEGKIDSTSYEDACRNILGNKSYILYTLDKIVQQSVKSLQTLSSDETTSKLIDIFTYYRLGKSGINPSSYHSHIKTCLQKSCEEMYRFQFVSKSSSDYLGEMTVACHYLGSINNSNEIPSDDDEYDENESSQSISVNK